MSAAYLQNLRLLARKEFSLCTDLAGTHALLGATGTKTAYHYTTRDHGYSGGLRVCEHGEVSAPNANGSHWGVKAKVLPRLLNRRTRDTAGHTLAEFKFDAVVRGLGGVYGVGQHSGLTAWAQYEKTTVHGLDVKVAVSVGGKRVSGLYFVTHFGGNTGQARTTNCLHYLARLLAISGT